MITLDGNSLSIHDTALIARDVSTRVELSETAVRAMRASRDVVEGWVERGEVIYGVTTGFGEFANVVISRENIERLQENLIRSHAVGAGDWIDAPTMRAMMALRVN
ncbi:MAG TPA: aromatic amino acid lyase, partial [Candidatus Kapabacteria bacterium]|nr:aromatic amino acid lyase [Candidatus Kapabacteria bacterium]